ncbi:hypothetical protein IQ270_28550 [Microcoleus sp. LEGE 07076]|uniref:hypothetical protein n=1 Tax=Microcoleus sp. LEGE 07076 TaxID=915322 RepID=UPI00187F27C9|nr:hypothetical protein [Microcoleus sp. LEGE 07076]MBE9188477.1 hypothetical protein [Microcoleus sp. LEGE 07076]
MNQVKKTTTKLNRSPVKVSEGTWQLGKLPPIDPSEEMTDARGLRELSQDDQLRGIAGTAETTGLRVETKTARARSPVASIPFAKWLLERLTRSKGWVALVTLGAVWGLWNSQLLFSTGVGIAAMILVYRGKSREWQLLRSLVEQFWESPNRRFVLAVGSGGIATLGAYMSLAIWADSESHWMAVSAILQNLGTIAIAGLLLQQALSWGVSKDEAALDRILADLTDADPVKRLIAVRQMTDLVNNSGFGRRSSVKSLLAKPAPRGTWPRKTIALTRAAECFRLMLSREPEALVRNAILEGLQTWDDTCRMTSKSKNKVIDY